MLQLASLVIGGFRIDAHRFGEKTIQQLVLMPDGGAVLEALIGEGDIAVVSVDTALDTEALDTSSLVATSTARTGLFTPPERSTIASR